VARGDRGVAGKDLGRDAVVRHGLVGIEQHARGEIELLAEGGVVSGGTEPQRHRQGRNQEDRAAEGGVERKSRHRVVFGSERL